MKLSSSQRWAIGAVSLAVLIACSPKTPEEPSQPEPNAPTLSPETVGGGGPTSESGPESAAPGFAKPQYPSAEQRLVEILRHDLH